MRIKVLLSIAVTACAFGLCMSATAFAEALLLPGPGVKDTTSSGASKFVLKSGLEIRCSSRSAVGEMETTTLGGFVSLYKGCSGPLGTKCTGLSNATTGEVSMSGKKHFVLVVKPGSEVIGFVYLLEPVHLSCGTILYELTGCVGGPLSPENTKTKTATNTFKQSKAVNEYTAFRVPGSGEEAACKLEVTIAGGEPEQEGEEITDEVMFSEEVELMS